MDSTDPINHPSHYTFGPIEVIDAIEAWKLPYHLGNVVKYVARSRHKGRYLEDLKKARWYLEREIEREENAQKQPVSVTGLRPPNLDNSPRLSDVEGKSAGTTEYSPDIPHPPNVLKRADGVYGHCPRCQSWVKSGVPHECGNLSSAIQPSVYCDPPLAMAGTATEVHACDIQGKWKDGKIVACDCPACTSSTEPAAVLVTVEKQGT